MTEHTKTALERWWFIIVAGAAMIMYAVTLNVSFNNHIEQAQKQSDRVDERVSKMKEEFTTTRKETLSGIDAHINEIRNQQSLSGQMMYQMSLLISDHTHRLDTKHRRLQLIEDRLLNLDLNMKDKYSEAEGQQLEKAFNDHVSAATKRDANVHEKIQRIFNFILPTPSENDPPIFGRGEK